MFVFTPYQKNAPLPTGYKWLVYVFSHFMVISGPGGLYLIDKNNKKVISRDICATKINLSALKSLGDKYYFLVPGAGLNELSGQVDDLIANGVLQALSTGNYFLYLGTKYTFRGNFIGISYRQAFNACVQLTEEASQYTAVKVTGTTNVFKEALKQTQQLFKVNSQIVFNSTLDFVPGYEDQFFNPAPTFDFPNDLFEAPNTSMADPNFLYKSVIKKMPEAPVSKPAYLFVINNGKVER